MRRNRGSMGGMAKIGDLLPQVIVRFGLHRRKNLEQLEVAWKEAVGERCASMTHIQRLHRGILTVKVLHNALIEELSFRQTELLNVLVPLLEGEPIKKIRFVV